MVFAATCAAFVAIQAKAQPIPGSDAAQRIALVLGRKIKITDQYLLTTFASYRFRIASDVAGAPSSDTTYADSVRLHAMCEVTSVTEDGEEYEKKLTIRYFHRFVNNATIDILPTGALVLVNFGGDAPTFTVNDSTPSTEVEELLRLAIRSEGGTSASEIINPSRPVQIGDTWSINKLAVAKSMSPGVAKPPTKGIDGNVRFVGIDTINARPCATVVAVIQQKTGTGTEKSPLQTSTYDMTLSAPLDTRYPVAASKVRTRFRSESRAKGRKAFRETDIILTSTFVR
ncbi:MAG: hypothetical protein SGJ05_11140 [bacterium]|nr:hypothetical protein [bacterium]